MRQIPKSRIAENQYTNGTGIGNNLALRFTTSKIPYVGFYSIINNNKYFTGKTFTDTSKSLETYNIIAKAVSVIATAGSVATLAHSAFNTSSSSTPIIRYFYKDLTSTSIKITEIDQNAYNQLSGNHPMTCQVISYNSKTQTLDAVDKQMPGLRTFLVT